MSVPKFEDLGMTKPAAKTMTMVVGIGTLCGGILLAGYKIGEVRSADRAEVEKICSEAVNKSNFATKAELEAEKAARNDSVYQIKLEQEQRWNAFLQKAWQRVP